MTLRYRIRYAWALLRRAKYSVVIVRAIGRLDRIRTVEKKYIDSMAERVDKMEATRWKLNRRIHNIMVEAGHVKKLKKDYMHEAALFAQDKAALDKYLSREFRVFMKPGKRLR